LGLVFPQIAGLPARKAFSNLEERETMSTVALNTRNIIEGQDAAVLAPAYRAVELLYHAFFPGFLLSIITRRSTKDAADLVFHTFRHQHVEKFLPGIKMLGLESLPAAVAAAQYHYMANKLGDVKVEYMYESDRKCWIRYGPPRWAWEGATICGIPVEVSMAMLKAWHSHNGVSLGNKRLGFVCTKHTIDGQEALEGYYYEHDHDLEPEERLRFARGEDAPDFDVKKAPKLDSASWPAQRLQKAVRNFAMDFTRNMFAQALSLFGPSDARYLIGHTLRLLGMQYYDETARLLGVKNTTAVAFAQYMVAMGQGQGDDTQYSVRGETVVVRQTGWKLMRETSSYHPNLFDAWNELWEGALSIHNRHLRLKVVSRMDAGDPAFEWEIETRRVPTFP
jgi:hypothetical protein